MAEANAADSTSLSALSPHGDVNRPTASISPAPIDRSAIMRRAHLIARRFVGILPNCLRDRRTHNSLNEG
jgi:hypothetical protein